MHVKTTSHPLGWPESRQIITSVDQNVRNDSHRRQNCDVDLVVAEKPEQMLPEQRIAAGAGVKVEDVHRMLKSFEQMQKLIKQFSGPGMGKKMKRMRGLGGFGGFPGF